MNDPLVGFDWQSLYARYDAACHRFDSHSQHLAFFKSAPPASDRELYYLLIKNFSLENLRKLNDKVGLYRAMLYWKLYSLPAASPNLNGWFSDDFKCADLNRKLHGLLTNLPNLSCDMTAIVTAVNYLGQFQLSGMRTHPSFPVRTTFLHFVFPNIVPILDKNVLEAVGVTEKGANQKRKYFEGYLPHAWSLAERYQHHFAQFKETPIRLIDMALWVLRDK